MPPAGPGQPILFYLLECPYTSVRPVHYPGPATHPAGETRVGIWRIHTNNEWERFLWVT